MNSPPLISELTTDEFRQKLAGLLDPQDNQSPERRTELKDMAIRFAACLPVLFGDDLDRKTLWNRIGSGILTAFAKTAGDDHECFIQQVLDHIKADPMKACSNADLTDIIENIGAWSSEDRQAWIMYFNTHLIPILVHARTAWRSLTARNTKKGGE